MLSEQTKTSKRHHIKFGRSGQWQRCWQRARSGAGGTQAPVTRGGAGWVQKGPSSGTKKDRRLLKSLKIIQDNHTLLRCYLPCFHQV